MAQVQDSFTRRLLLRASLRRVATAQQSNDEVLRRKRSILKAINAQPDISLQEVHRDANNNESPSSVAQQKCSVKDSGLPLMESTRKIPHSESTKILYSPSSKVTSTISTIGGFVETSGEEETSEDINEAVFAEIPAYDENNFLVDALGEALNDTSVTYDASAWEKSRSDFDASDLMSRNNFSVDETSVFEATIALLMSGLQPRSSSTLNRSMMIDPAVWEEIVKPKRSQRVSRLRAFLRLLRRLLRGVKKFVGLQDSNER